MKPTFTTSFNPLAANLDLSHDVKQVEIFLRENAVSNAVITLKDELSKTFENNISQYDSVRIDIKGVGQSEVERFGGYVTHSLPTRDLSGKICRINSVGYGVALNRMRVAQEYGTQSNNPTLDTIREILTDASYGIIPKYVNKIFASASSSQYDIQTASGGDNYIENEVTSLRYVKCPYTPAAKVLNQLCDLISADNYTDEGTHWQVIPSSSVPYLCVATVNNHAAPITDLWPNDSPAPTIVEGVNVISQDLTKSPAQANYIVYFGKFQKPTAERATEGASPHSLWASTSGTLSTSATAQVGSASTLCTENGAGTIIFYYPGAGDMNLNVEDIGTYRSIPSINFYLKTDNAPMSPTIQLETVGGSGNYYYHTCYLPDTDWHHFSFPIGAYYDRQDYTVAAGRSNFKWLTNGAGYTWADIDRIRFAIAGLGVGAGATLYVDDFHIDGIITRGAKCANAIQGAGAYDVQRCKMELVTDSLATDDSILASDDSGTVAQLAKAHLLRAKVTPIAGKIVIPLNENILPGQIQAIQVNKQRDGTYKIDDDFRILEVHHTVTRTGGITELTVTDDIVNGIARDPTNSYNNMQRAVSPDFQTTTNADLKARDIDILQTILETNYA